MTGISKSTLTRNKRIMQMNIEVWSLLLERDLWSVNFEINPIKKEQTSKELISIEETVAMENIIELL